MDILLLHPLTFNVQMHLYYFKCHFVTWQWIGECILTSKCQILALAPKSGITHRLLQGFIADFVDLFCSRHVENNDDEIANMQLVLAARLTAQV